MRENAASVGVARIREIIQDAGRRIEEGAGRTILFLDEIHRFSKSQQDVLLGDVERGVIILIGATTENPMFAVNSALVSRSTVFRLESLSEDDIAIVIRRAIEDVERGYGELKLTVDDEAIAHWAQLSDGEVRKLSVDTLEAYIAKSGDVTPVHYLVDRFCRDPAVTQAEAAAKFAQLMEQLMPLAERAGLIPNGKTMRSRARA